MKPRKLITAAIVYAVVVIAVMGVVALRARARAKTVERKAEQIALAERKAKSDDPEVKKEGEAELEAARREADKAGAVTADPEAKPAFSLSTNRTYGTTNNARVWVNYQGIKNLDFRVYRVSDPAQFFKQLGNPHELGEGEKKEVASAHSTSPSVLERVRAFKSAAYKMVKTYLREQIRRESRTTFNEKFRKERDRTPLNVSDYARVPLLNPELVGSWREELAPLDYAYDTLMVPLGKRQPGVYLVEAANGPLRAYTIAVISDITILNKSAANGDMFVYAADRRTGAPREGVSVEIARRQKTLATGTTDKNGVFQTRIKKEKQEPQASPSPSPSPSPTPAEETEDEEASNEPSDAFLIMAQQQDHFAISDLEAYSLGMNEDGDATDQGVTGYIYTDRPIYRPEHKVYFKGILRRLGDQGYEMLAERSVSVTVEDPNGGKLMEKELPLSSRGSFSGEVELAGGAALGSYRVVAQAGDASASNYFEVQEYKKPEYKVSVSAPKKYAPVGSTIKFSVEARYFFGAPVTTADVKYYIYRSRYYQYWAGEEYEGEEEDDSYEGGYYGYGNDLMEDGEETLNKNGRLEVEFTVPEPEDNDPYDYTYRLEAQVTDSARRTIEGSASFVGTRGSVVANASPNRYVYVAGETAKINVQTATYEGKPVSANVTLEFAQRTWDKTPSEYGGFDYNMRETKLASANVTTNEQGMASYDYPITASGSVYIKTIVNDNGKQYVSNSDFLWVTDERNAWMDTLNEDYGAIKLVPDKKSYKPGETAHVLAMLPEDKAHLIVTTEMESVMKSWPVDASARAVMIDVPIEARYAPNVYLNVSFIKDDEMFTSDRSLKVPASDKLLNLEIIPNKKEYKPRETASYTILARKSDGSPASGAEVSLGVVDEAIYSIKPEQATDIYKGFYGHRYNQVQTNFAVSYYFSGTSGDDALAFKKNRRSFQLADFKNEGQYAETAIRKEFKDTAFWQPDVVTNAEGRAEVKVELPDNLTTWRATVRAVTDDTRVGSSVGRVVARKDLIMRLEMPRFFTEGDTVTLSGNVHNYLKTAKQTQISIAVEGAQLLDGATQTVNIDKNGEHRVDWRINASQIGQVRVLAKALTDEESDAVEMTLEVIPRGLRQNRAEVSSLTDEQADKSFSLNLPGDAHPQARYLRIEASPSVAGTLFGALDYLTGYPYGCTEQTMSRFLPNIIVAQALQEVKSATLRDTNKLGEKVQRGLDRLYSYQHSDGGWGWWKNDKTDGFMTAYVVDGLTMAKNAGYAVDESRVGRGRDKLKEMLEANKDDEGKELDLETRAYMVYSLSVSGGSADPFIDDLYNKRNGLQPYGRALLALTQKGRGDPRMNEVAGEIERSAKVNDFHAYWESGRKPMLDFVENNSIEASALSIKALAQITPQSELLPKAARWLVASRRNGNRWDSTKDTAFAIYGLTDYLKVSRELQPDYTLEVYVNGAQVLSQRMTAQEAAAGQPFIVQQKGGEVAGNNEVRVVKRGRGTLYLSANLDYYTGGENTAAQASDKLKLTREYLRLRVTEPEVGEDGVSKPAKWAIEPLKGEIRSGDLIVVKLHVEGAKGEYMMIEDPIPAGCEQVERTSGIDLNYSAGRWTDWYSAREFRDQRTAIFLNRFDGDATFQYAMRAQVPGEFRVAPARAELMYQPSVRSNTASSTMSIMERK
ncbi:MAG: MG2 domain-containing protein [Pyrinomonadaceae bacterium]